MGTATVLSFADVKAANKMYTCDAQCADRSACPRGGYRDKHCVCMCEGEPLAEDGRTTVPCSENFHSDKLAHMLRDSWRNVPECKNWWHDVHCEPLEQRGLCTDPYKGKWMRDHCMKTCGCCYDHSHACEYWAEMGYCAANSQWKPVMEAQCRKTCGLCQGGYDASQRDERACQDTTPDYLCQSYKDRGECETVSQTQVTCKATCGLCK